MDDFSPLDETRHMLQWLADEPYQQIRDQVARLLVEQQPGSKLEEFRVVTAPQWLTGARPSEEDADKAILVRTGVAFGFVLRVADPAGDPHELRGVYTWVGVRLDDPPNRQQQIWFDLDGDLEQLGSEGRLQERVYFA